MSTSITAYPEKTIETGYKSRTINVGHPTNKAVYTFLRKDTGVVSVIEGQTSNIILRGVSRTLTKPINGKVFVKYAGDYNDVSGTITSTNETVLGADIVTDIPFTRAMVLTAGNYANINSNSYLLTVTLYNADTGLIIATSKHESAPDGTIYYDAGPYLRSEMEVRYNLDNLTLNQSDTKLSIPFYITYQETYLGEAQTLVSDSDNVFTAVYGSGRVTDKYGQYVQPAFDANLLEPNKGKFTTRFHKPCYFPGYPFNLAVHYQQGSSTNIPFKEEVFYNSGRTSTGGDSTQLLSTEDYKYLQQLVLKGGYFSTVEEVDMFLSQDGLEIGCLALDATDFNIDWVLNESDVLQYIDLLITSGEQIDSIDTYPSAKLYNNAGVLVETIAHGGSGRYTPVSTHTIDTGIWSVVFTDVEVTLNSGDACDISLENEFDSSLCGIDYDTIGQDLIVYANDAN